ncbi:hypothetical protein IU483_30300 [Streptomyces gardneri]|nr:hypothetical protein [Streptomyces gardneri]
METTAAVPLRRDDAHRPYGAAVIDALQRAGLTVLTCDYGADDDRDMCFGLAETLGGDQVEVGWSEVEGWSWVSWSEPRGSEPTGYGWFDLPPVPVPDAVAVAIRHRLGLAPVHAAPIWTPPPGHDTGTTSRPDSENNEAADAALAVYLTHPAWTAGQPLSDAVADETPWSPGGSSGGASCMRP